MSDSPSTKVYVDWGKLVQIVLIITAAVVLGITGTISGDAVIGILSAAAGYIFGNGKSVREGHPTAPLLGVRAHPQEVADTILEVVELVDEDEAP